MRGIFLCVCITTGCGPTATDVRPVESGLAAAVSLGQSASLSMRALAATTACASIKTACSGYPCDAAVTVTLGSNCPLPLGGEESGTVEVSGHWQTVDSATVSDTFVGVKAGTRSAMVVDAKNLSVTSSGNVVSLRYTWQDVNVVSGAATLSAQSSWTVDVDSSDGSYTINGTDQGVSTQVSQISVSGVVVKPSCTRNPVAGSATIQKVSTLSIVQATVSFHPACDGKADVNGDSVTLDFLR